MHTATYDEQKFGKEFLGQVLDWVVENLKPDEVYKEDALKEFIKDNYEAWELYDEDQLLEALEEVTA